MRRREAEAQAVLSGVVEGVYAVDKDRLIRYLNPQAARLLNVTPEQAVGQFCGDILKPRFEEHHGITYANDALKAEAVRTALKAQGTDPVGGTPKEFADFIRADIDKWAGVLAASDAKR